MATQQTFAFLTPSTTTGSQNPRKNRQRKSQQRKSQQRKSQQRKSQLGKSQQGNSQPVNPQAKRSLDSHRPASPHPASPPATTKPLSTPDAAELPMDRDSVLARLRSKVGCITAAPPNQEDVFSTGAAAIDQVIPNQGLKVDGMTEWLTHRDGCGANILSLIAAGVRLRSDRRAGPLVVVDIEGTFYPPAAVALGVPAERMILVKPRKHSDSVWAIDQALRCESTAAVWACVGKRLDDRDARRFQLACEQGHTPALFVRPAAVRGKPSFADVRFHVENTHIEDVNLTSASPAASRGDLQTAFHVTLDRCRGGAVGKSVSVWIDDQVNIRPVPHGEPSRHETAAVHLASELARPKTAKPSRKRRA